MRLSSQTDLHVFLFKIGESYFSYCTLMLPCPPRSPVMFRCNSTSWAEVFWCWWINDHQLSSSRQCPWVPVVLEGSQPCWGPAAFSAQGLTELEPTSWSEESSSPGPWVFFLPQGLLTEFTSLLGSPCGPTRLEPATSCLPCASGFLPVAAPLRLPTPQPGESFANKGSCDYAGPTRIFLDDLPMSRSTDS